MSVNNWLAAHIFYAAPPEPMLTEVLAPLVTRILSQDMARGFFFIRYPEQGQHVRLRFQGDPTVMARDIKPLLQTATGDWCQRFPSQRDKEWQNRDDLPNDSLHYFNYEPEYSRYGGKLGTAIAEQQFQHSSKAVLNLMAESDWNYDRALGCALQIHLAFMYALGWNLDQVRSFCDLIAHIWLPMAWHWAGESTAFEKHKEETLAAFKEAFDQQQEALVPFVQTYWQGLQDQADFDAPWLDTWIEGMQEITRQLDEATNQGSLQIPPTRIQPSHPLPEYWPILESYVHMTNNRLGILNRDEAFLGYLIHNTIAKI